MLNYNQNLSENLLKRFWSKVKKTDSCWLWTGSTYDGYGQFFYIQGTAKAHRVAWEMENGKIPNGKCLLHKCDIRGCVRPDHLWLGTRKENNLDRDRKGRQKSLSGEKNGNSKLTQKQIIDIRNDSRTLMEIAKDYNIHFGHVGHIKQRNVWKNII